MSTSDVLLGKVKVAWAMNGIWEHTGNFRTEMSPLQTLPGELGYLSTPKRGADIMDSQEGSRPTCIFNKH